MKPIVIVPEKVLFTPAQPVPAIDAKIKTILKDMKEALLAAHDPKGVGLAAPQIGVNLRMFCLKATSSSPVEFFLNPQILTSAPTTAHKNPQDSPRGEAGPPLEGCLSIPNTWGFVERNSSVILKFTNEKNQTKTREFTGFHAIIIQHEMDHLEGILFTQRVLEQGHKLYEIIKNKQGKETLKELPL